jgi:hypothetical protein
VEHICTRNKADTYVFNTEVLHLVGKIAISDQLMDKNSSGAGVMRNACNDTNSSVKVTSIIVSDEFPTVQGAHVD